MNRNERGENGGPAFPCPHVVVDANDPFFKLGAAGLSLRDYFASDASRGAADNVCDYLEEGHDQGAKEEAERHARAAYMVADAMLKARER